MVLLRFNPGIPLYQGAIQTMQALNKLPTPATAPGQPLSE